MNLYTGSGVTILPKIGGSAGSTGSVYAASLTVTPLGERRQQGNGRLERPRLPPAESTPGGFGVTFLARTPLWLDSAGQLQAARSGTTNLRAWVDGQDTVGHWG